MVSILSRLVAALGRFVGWPQRRGRWVAGSAADARGRLAIAPFVAPRRQFLLYVPRGYTRWRRNALIVLCHGCQQTPEDFATGTRIAEFADARRALVLMPRQRTTANAWSCWNWFDPASAAGEGEAAIIAAMTCKVARRHPVDARRVVAAGMSAGGALAAILGLRYASLYRAVVAHSGIACGAAATPLGAKAVLRDGPQTDVVAIGRDAREHARRVPLLAIQGMADDVVAPRNATALCAQYLARAGFDCDGETLPAASADRRVADEEKPLRIREWRDDGGLVARLVEIDGLGHAWSGGDAALRFNAADAPDALAMVGEFLRDVARPSATMRFWRRSGQ